MANILYGVSGEGYGHAARSKEVVAYLMAQGHKVTLLSYDRGQEYLARFFPVKTIVGFNFTYENNQVKYFKTLYRNFLRSADTVRSLESIVSLVDEQAIDLVISDFEPLVALAAKWKRLPLISFDNQHVMTKTRHEYPKAYKRAWLTDRVVTSLMIPPAAAYIVLSFFPCRPLSKKVKIFSPLVKSELLKIQPTVGDYAVVYITSKFEGFVEILAAQNSQFIVYGLGARPTQGNLQFKEFDQTEFNRDLAACRSLIATAGFSLISEALYLGKPYLAVPAAGQFEQILNAYHLAKLGYGEHQDKLTVDSLKHFLTHEDEYRANLAGGLKPGNEAVFAYIGELINRLKK